MGKKGVSLIKINYWFLVLLILYQDSPLNKTLGSFGDSPLGIICLVELVIMSVFTGKMILNELEMKLMKLMLWLVIVSFTGAIIWSAINGSVTVRNEDIYFKAIKSIITFLSLVSYLILIRLSVNQMNIKEIFSPIIFGLLLMTGICLAEIFLIPNALPFMHSQGIFPYYHVRLLTKEPSNTTLMILLFGNLSVLYCIKENKRLLLILSLLCCLVLVITTASKTLLIGVGVELALFALFNGKKLSRNTVFAIILLIIIATYVYIHYLLPMLLRAWNNDILNFTSTSTRTYTVFIGYLLGIRHPFGVGGALILTEFPEMMERFMWIFDRINIKLNISEIMLLITRQTGEALNPKSGFALYSVYWGLLGNVYFLRTVLLNYKGLKKYNSSMEQMILRIVLILFIILVALFSNMSFEFFFLIALVNSFVNNDVLENVLR